MTGCYKAGGLSIALGNNMLALRMSFALGTAVVLVILAAGPGAGRSASSAVMLRVESLSPHEVQVRVSSGPPGIWSDSARSAEPQAQIVARTPAALGVA